MREAGSDDARPTTATARAPDEEPSPLLVVGVVVLERFRLLLLVGAFAAVTAIGFLSMKAPEYSSQASFVLGQADGGRGALVSLAAQFGVAAAAGAGSAQSPKFYADLVSSREVLDPVVDSLFLDESRPPHRVPLAVALAVEEETPVLTREETMRVLRRTLDVTTSRETGLITVSAHTPSRTLSRQLVERVVHEVEALNRSLRQSRAAEEVRFISERLLVAQEELRVAEADLASFLRRNRQIGFDPGTQVESDRLQRRVSARESVASTLDQGLEQARLDALRDTPTLLMVERPREAVLPLPRYRLVLGAVFGAFAAMVTLIGLVVMERSRAASGTDTLRAPLRGVPRTAGADLPGV